MLSIDNERLVGQPILRLQEEIAKAKANNNTTADSLFTLFVFILKNLINHSEVRTFHCQKSEVRQ